MCANIFFLRIEHNACYTGLLKKAYGICHQADANSLPARGWLDGDAHKVAILSIQSIELVANNITIEFRYYEIGMCSGYVIESDPIKAPEFFEAGFIDSEQGRYIARLY